MTATDRQTSFIKSLQTNGEQDWKRERTPDFEIFRSGIVTMLGNGADETIAATPEYTAYVAAREAVQQSEWGSPERSVARKAQIEALAELEDRVIECWKETFIAGPPVPHRRPGHAHEARGIRGDRMAQAMNGEEFGARLAALGLSQSLLARCVGKSQAQVSRIVAGKSPVPDELGAFLRELESCVRECVRLEAKNLRAYGRPYHAMVHGWLIEPMAGLGYDDATKEALEVLGSVVRGRTYGEVDGADVAPGEVLRLRD